MRPNFLFHSICNCSPLLFSLAFFHFFSLTFATIPTFSQSLSRDPGTASDDVTLSSELTVWGESYYFAPAVWVKSPLTEIREHCLLGPALLQLPHRHTWRALQHQLRLALLSHFAERTVWSRPVIENCMLLAHSLGLMLEVWTKHMRDLKDQIQLWYSGVWSATSSLIYCISNICVSFPDHPDWARL